MTDQRLNAEDAENGRGTQRENLIGTAIVECALKVHTVLGPGLLEAAYEACLAYELSKRGLAVRRQIVLPLRYEDIVIEGGFRIDLLVDECVAVEVKAVESIVPIHSQQLLSYLRFGNYRLGYLLNFNVLRMRDGIRRVANGL